MHFSKPLLNTLNTALMSLFHLSSFLTEEELAHQTNSIANISEKTSLNETLLHLFLTSISLFPYLFFGLLTVFLFLLCSPLWEDISPAGQKADLFSINKYNSSATLLNDYTTELFNLCELRLRNTTSNLPRLYIPNSLSTYNVHVVYCVIDYCWLRDRR